MPLFDVVYTFKVEAATPNTAEELVDEACHFDHEEPVWLQIRSVIANIYELIPKKASQNPNELRSKEEPR